MQVLGDLVKLPEANSYLPLPWWHRAPLGLIHGTSVYVAILKRDRRPVGDIIISVLNPDKWENMLRLECRHEDAPGVILRLLKAVRDLNIALGETVTVETGLKHSACFICEAVGGEKATSFVSRIQDFLKHEDFDGGVVPFSKAPLPIESPCERDRVDHGWLRGVRWRQRFADHFPEEQARPKVDLTRVVVSADTEKRLLRYVFPLQGAITAKIRHADEPGALRALSQALVDGGANVLSAILRRGGQPVGRAELVAVCEPARRVTGADLQTQIEQRVKKVDRRYEAHLQTNDGRPATEVITIPESDDPAYGGAVPILLWQRYLSGGRRDGVSRMIRKVLVSNGCRALEAGGEEETRRAPGSSSCLPMRPWKASAVIVPVVGVPDADDPTFCLNLASDLGLLRTLGKPILLVVEEGRARALEAWTPPDGVIRQGLPFDATTEDLGNLFTKWLGMLDAAP